MRLQIGIVDALVRWEHGIEVTPTQPNPVSRLHREGELLRPEYSKPSCPNSKIYVRTRIGIWQSYLFRKCATRASPDSAWGARMTCCVSGPRTAWTPETRASHCGTKLSDGSRRRSVWTPPERCGRSCRRCDLGALGSAQIFRARSRAGIAPDTREGMKKKKARNVTCHRSK
jgi:hypothetical protein